MRYSWWALLLCLSPVVTGQAEDVQPHDNISARAVLVMESPYSFDDTVSNLRDAIGASNFRLIREQPWDYGLETDAANSRDTILYFCNFDMVNGAIKLDKRVGQLLPFQITVAEQGDRVWVAAVNPEAVMQLMQTPRLSSFRTRAASMYQQIIEEGLF